MARTSQFHGKVEVHENKHHLQYLDGIAKGIQTVEEAYARISSLTAPTQMVLATIIRAELQRYTRDEARERDTIHEAMELEAYAESDPVAPRHIFQACNRALVKF